MNFSQQIFNGDSTITSAVLDRLLDHAETIIIEGSRYRMKDRIETYLQHHNLMSVGNASPFRRALSVDAFDAFSR